MVRNSALSPVDRVIERHSKNSSDDSQRMVALWKQIVAQEILISEQKQRDLWAGEPRVESHLPSYLLMSETKPVEPWFRQLFSRLEKDTTTPESIFSSPFWIWTFNYDRLVEQLFYNAFCANFDLTQQEALRLVRQVPIKHIHGDVGEYLPSDGERRSLDSVRYGSPSPGEVTKAASRIRPAHEPLKRELIESLWEPLEPYRSNLRFVFLGFGFDSDNVNKLRIVPNVGPHFITACHATWHGGVGRLPVRVREVMSLLGIRPARDGDISPTISSLLDSITD